MYQVALNSNIESNSFYKQFSSYTRARDYANRLFHKRHTLPARQQGYPAEDFIAFNNSDFSETEEITVYSRHETFTLSISRIIDVGTVNRPDIISTGINSEKILNNSKFGRKLYSIKDHIDSIHIRLLLITNILESNPVCPGCGEVFNSKNNITVKKLDNRKGYTRSNCYLKHRECQKSPIRTSIKFIYSE